MGTELGKLERLNPREVWENEASYFTPWLAEANNLGLLGETIGLELECEAQERRVGPFRADILARDTATGEWVLIENQLESTDHIHLGQLLTYAAGLKAVTVVWVAQHFTDEHRAALDWLNEITAEGINFFGLEIELWRIDGSRPAPKFNVVSKPNEWSRTITGAAEQNLSETQQLYLEYWSALKEHLKEQKSSVQMGKPQPQLWMTFPTGRSSFYISASVSRQKQIGWVSLVIYCTEHVTHFRQLQQDKEAIEAEIGHALEWRELPQGKESHIRQCFSALNPASREDWPRQHDLFQKALERFTACFRPRVKTLYAMDMEEEEPSDVEA